MLYPEEETGLVMYVSKPGRYRYLAYNLQLCSHDTEYVL